MCIHIKLHQQTWKMHFSFPSAIPDQLVKPLFSSKTHASSSSQIQWYCKMQMVTSITTTTVCVQFQNGSSLTQVLSQPRNPDYVPVLAFILCQPANCTLNLRLPLLLTLSKLLLQNNNKHWTLFPRCLENIARCQKLEGNISQTDGKQ